MDYVFINIYDDGLKMIGSTQEPRGLKFEGDEGWIFVHVHDPKVEASDPRILESVVGKHEIHLGRSPGHHRNFLDCVKLRQEPMAPAEVGHRTATICHLNNIAMKLGRTVRWDPVNEVIVGDDEANALAQARHAVPLGAVEATVRRRSARHRFGQTLQDRLPGACRSHAGPVAAVLAPQHRARTCDL